MECQQFPRLFPQTPYFLITDSDTFFTNRWQALDLMLQKDCNATSGVCDLRRKVSLRCDSACPSRVQLKCAVYGAQLL